MPGISLVIDTNGGLNAQGKWLRSSLDSLMHYPEYEQKIPVHEAMSELSEKRPELYERYQRSAKTGK